MEKVELVSRLSAFDSFMFLVQTNNEAGENPNNQSYDAQSCRDETKEPVHNDLQQGVSVEKVTETAAATTSPSLPIHESNVRCVPGSREERKELSNRLRAFDQYMFLLNDQTETARGGKTISDKEAKKTDVLNQVIGIPTANNSDLPAFLPAMIFQGSKPGYVFRNSHLGLGYYLDDPAARLGNDEEGAKPTVKKKKVKVKHNLLSKKKLPTKDKRVRSR
jgi:small nuclear ribonucleoprotein (snRNP)-like protein